MVASPSPGPFMPADAPPVGTREVPAARTPSQRQGLAAVPNAPAPLWSGVEIETAELLKAAIPAHRALAACARAFARTPLDSAALDAFALLDAVGAVQLDGEPLDPREVLESPPQQRDAVVVRQHEALRHALREARPVGSAVALELASLVAGRTVAVRRQTLDTAEPGLDPGALGWRAVPLPLGAERLRVRLDRWQDFVQSDSGDLDALLMSGTALAEWLAVRPFSSGNVRVGQLLVQLLMLEEDLLPVPALPLSLYMSRHSEACWRALHAARAAAHPEPWLRFFLGAVEHVSLDTLTRIDAWEAVLAVLPVTLGELLPKTPSAELIQVCARPSLGMSDVIDTGLSRRQTAAAWLARLVDGGVLRERRAGKEKRFVNEAVVSLLVG